MNAIIIHGTGGSPEGNWFPWLMTELEKKGYTVHIPRFPTPDGQNLEAWLEAFKPYEQYMGDCIIIGHSLGPAFILTLLETHKAKAAYLVSGFLGLLHNPSFDELNKTFMDKDFDFEEIKKNCPHFTIINSDNDPYVPLDKGREISNLLQCPLIILKGAGHINSEVGITEFPLLNKLIQ
jgi:predicted alpha/beta hydrolase family esterase